MAHNPVRKFVSLIFIYSITIFGIFMLQFRNEFSFSETFGLFRLRLSYTKIKLHSDAARADDKSVPAEQALKNAFYVSGEGLTLFAAATDPLILQTSDGKSLPLMLHSWEKNGDTGFSLLFSENVTLIFNTSSDKLSLYADFPPSGTALTIPYKTTERYSVTDINQSRALIKSKSDIRMLQAQTVTKEHILISPSSSFARFVPYEEITVFSFASIANTEKAGTPFLERLKTEARAKIADGFSSVPAESLNENIVSAYIAESALRGAYHTAVASIPFSFKDGTKRTYISAPYFNTLTKMNQTFVMERENISYRMQYSFEKRSLDVFELDRLPSMLLLYPLQNTTTLSELPASMENFAPNIAQAAGILEVYAVLHKVQPANAARLEPVLESCISVLESSCVLTESGELYLEDKTGRASPVLTAKAASALQEYGTLKANGDIQAGGRLLLASLLLSTETTDIKTLAAVYPYISGNNRLYPHLEVIGFENNMPVWAWTAAAKISYTKNDGIVTLQTLFTEDETHYMILGGIEPFISIEIYGLQYRSDPRFETYNSSGYVYDAGTKTLLLKFKHKSPMETVRLFYRAKPVERLLPEEKHENDAEKQEEAEQSDSEDAENSADTSDV